jgi:DNA-binding NtrC family response regulator
MRGVVLLVAHHRDTASSCVRPLEDLGFTVRRVTKLAIAIELLRKERFDASILEIAEDARESLFVRSLRAQDRDLPVIVLGGPGPRGSRSPRGEGRFVPIPVNPTRLCAAVAAAANYRQMLERWSTAVEATHDEWVDARCDTERYPSPPVGA